MGDERGMDERQESNCRHHRVEECSERAIRGGARERFEARPKWRALAANRFAMAVSALTAKAKLAGLWVDRTQSVHTNVTYAVSESAAERGGMGSDARDEGLTRAVEQRVATSA